MSICDPDRLLKKLKTLPPKRIAKIEDFVDFLRARDEQGEVTHAAGSRAEEPLRKIWDSAEDADCDRL